MSFVMTDHVIEISIDGKHPFEGKNVGINGKGKIYMRRHFWNKFDED